MRKIIGVTVGTPLSADKIKEKIKPVMSVNGVEADETGNVQLETSVPSEEIRAAIEAALQEAKDSGEFDGYSPVITVTVIAGGHRVSITDAKGTKTFDVLNGKDGSGGGVVGDFLPLAGGTLKGALTLAGDPTEDLHAASKQYVDNVLKNLNPDATAVELDTTLTVEGKAADAKAVGDALANIQMSGGGITPVIANALLACFANVAWTTANGQEHYKALQNLLFPAASVASISAVFTQGNTTIFDDQEIDGLRKYLIVTAYYSDGTSKVVTDYTLSGELIAGTSTVTVTCDDVTDTFDVTVTAFVLPEGYTRYGYIEKKTTSQNKVASSSFIYLKAYEDMNVLSMEATLGSKPNTTTRDGAGLMGARLASGDGYPYYAVYWPNNESMWVGARNKKCDCSLPTDITKVKLGVDNPATSPFSVKVNNGAAVECAWTDSPVIPHGMCLFNNIPDGSTSTFYINRHVRIGDILFRSADGECVGYYTPVTYDGKIGMYDQISKAFYTAETAAAVTVGNSGCYYAVGNWA